MVTKEDVEQLMLQNFPLCPLCGANKGYEVSGFAKNYVQCRSCGAKWTSTDFIEGKELRELQLWEPSYDGKGTSLLKKKYSVKFWQDSETIRTTEVKVAVEGTKLIFNPEMTNQQLQTSIVKSMEEITRWDYGSTLEGKLGLLFGDSTSAEATMIRLLRAIFEQNKVLIMQNELIRRALTKSKNSKSG